MPIVRGLLDGTLWDGVDLLPPLRPALPEAPAERPRRADGAGHRGVGGDRAGVRGGAGRPGGEDRGRLRVRRAGSPGDGRPGQAAGAEPVVAQADLGDPEAAKGLRAAAGDGGVDILVNNAGLTRDGPGADARRGLHQRARGQPGGGLLHQGGPAGHAAAPLGPGDLDLQRGRAGRQPRAANYAASKAGPIGLTMSVAREVAGRGITVNAVAPGYIPSKLTDAMSEEAKQATLSRSRWDGSAPRRRCGGGPLPGRRRGRLHHRPGPGR